MDDQVSMDPIKWSSVDDILFPNLANWNRIQFNSFIFLHKQVKIKCQHIMMKITSMEKKGIQN
jgi:hypothetical protein